MSSSKKVLHPTKRPRQVIKTSSEKPKEKVKYRLPVKRNPIREMSNRATVAPPYVPASRLDKWVWDTLQSGKDLTRSRPASMGFSPSDVYSSAMSSYKPVAFSYNSSAYEPEFSHYSSAYKSEFSPAVMFAPNPSEYKSEFSPAVMFAPTPSEYKSEFSPAVMFAPNPSEYKSEFSPAVMFAPNPSEYKVSHDYEIKYTPSAPVFSPLSNNPKVNR
jgi:hypothetical protein